MMRFSKFVRIHNFSGMRFLLFLFLSFGVFSVNAQSKMKKLFINNWKKTDVTALDGSKYYDPEVQQMDLDLDVLSSDSLGMFNSGRLNYVRYRLGNDSILVVSGLRLKITEITDIKMEMEVVGNEGYDLKFTFMPKNLYDLTYTPDAYRAKNGTIVFESNPGRLEPMFLSKNMSPMDYIFERFGFPEHRKGGFVVRFIITDKGEITGTRLVASSNDRYNDQLIAAVNSTKGMWKPAIFKGEPVNSEIEYDYNLGYVDRKLTSDVDSSSYSKMYYDYGLEFISTGAYKNAANYLKKSIDFNPLNINAYYKHAEVSFALRRKEEGCESLSYLILLDQKKAESLFEKNCK